ncbi:MAG: hypothetical protein JWL73_85 [Actinomycetia bacterium]|nr:hypothetical protein [Actinomycetes bacterium]
MIVHSVAFSLGSHVTDDVRANLLTELAAFPKLYPQMRHWRLGRNISQRDQTYEYAFVVEFDGLEALNQYLESESHELFVQRRWQPLVSRRAICTFEA